MANFIMADIIWTCRHRKNKLLPYEVDSRWAFDRVDRAGRGIMTKIKK